MFNFDFNSLFRALYELLKDWVGWVFCFIIQQVIDILYLIVSTVSNLWPNVPVPSFLSDSISTHLTANALQLIAWVMPTGLFIWAMSAWLTYEIIMTGALPTYRAIMDLF